ncbi:hypothetical protein HPB47_011280 [Ixodes persulcatus]|uniref:Uncharacterized protein n=1 Tax=Ixodes persulcatus TaxID=34615 RepID=A0AC60NWR4_IXOPE|nr:hypothetical protein HPB47_011280 [Ixodes persulcatus]
MSKTSATSSRLRLLIQDGIALLREVHATNCLEDPSMWATIAGNLLLATREHFSTKLKSVDVVRAYVKRLEEVNPALNAVTDTRYEEALTEAEEVDRQVAEGAAASERDQPLLGIPFTVKNTIGVRGCLQDCGSFYSKGRRSPEDAQVVALMRKAGAIPVAISSVPELCLSLECNSVLHGTTCNPYDSNRSPGGSSGGEASLLGAAASVIGLGTDLAGSIRHPAGNCGVFGHKPTHGIVSRHGLYPDRGEAVGKFSTPGPMCRYAADLLPMLRVMAGENAPRLALDSPAVDFLFLHPLMSTSKNPPYRIEDFKQELERLNILKEVASIGAYQMNHVWIVTLRSSAATYRLVSAKELTVKGRRRLVIDPSNAEIRLKIHWISFHVSNDAVDLKKLKVFYLVDDGNKYIGRLQKKFSQAVLDAVACLEPFCEARPRQVSFEELPRASRIWMATVRSGAPPPFAEVLKNSTDKLNPLTELALKLVGRSHHTVAAIVVALREREKDFTDPARVADLTAQGQRFVRKLEELLQDGDAVLVMPAAGFGAPGYHGQWLTNVDNVNYTCLFNTAMVPATACPLYLDKRGLPVGVQVVAARYKDRLCLAVARELASKFGGWRAPETRTSA